jgi:hypothetical protein
VFPSEENFQSAAMRGVSMNSSRLRSPRLGLAAAALVPAFALAGCASTIDNGKANQLIRKAVASGDGTLKLKSVDCPGGVTAKAGGTFTCKVSLTQVSNGSVHSGTVTVHMTNSSGHVVVGPSDFHLQ